MSDYPICQHCGTELDVVPRVDRILYRSRRPGLTLAQREQCPAGSVHQPRPRR